MDSTHLEFEKIQVSINISFILSKKSEVICSFVNTAGSYFILLSKRSQNERFLKYGQIVYFTMTL